MKSFLISLDPNIPAYEWGIAGSPILHASGIIVFSLVGMGVTALSLWKVSRSHLTAFKISTQSDSRQKVRTDARPIKSFNKFTAFLESLNSVSCASICFQFSCWAFVGSTLSAIGWFSPRTSYLGQQFDGSLSSNNLATVLGASASILFPVLIFIIGMLGREQPLQIPRHELFLKYSYALPCSILMLSGISMLALSTSHLAAWFFSLMSLFADSFLLIRLLNLLLNKQIQLNEARRLFIWKLHSLLENASTPN